VCNDARWKGPRSSYCSGPKIQPRGGGLGGRARAMTYHTVAVLSGYSTDTWLR
jgi:hypothetical protein